LSVELSSLLPEELAPFLIGYPAYRTRQVFRWLQKGVQDFQEMTDVPQPLREQLTSVGYLVRPAVVRKQQARDGTVKFLWEFMDGERVESVVMRYQYGSSLCISTQAGCRQGCLFCASTVGGLTRNLTAGEMLAQITGAVREMGENLSRVVLMGIGEPMDNFAEVARFLRLLSHPEGLHMSPRHISLSTCGLIEGIDALAALALPVTLSVSLHAPDDETRTKLMPGNVGIAPLLKACERYFQKTGRRVSYEYVLLRDLNDTSDMAHHLGRLLKGAPSHVNLIAYNATKRGCLAPSAPERVKEFMDILCAHGVAATCRRRLGREIDAACGQLRKSASLPHRQTE
jgi:23S rRNA (adenine2503-C2)-methyltransferase